MKFTKKYLDYLASAAWQEKKYYALERAGFMCELCSNHYKRPQMDCPEYKRSGVACNVCLGLEQPVALHVHHLNYDRLYDELPSDLQVACELCHPTADAIRRAAKRRAEEERAQAKKSDNRRHRKSDREVFGKLWQKVSASLEQDQKSDIETAARKHFGAGSHEFFRNCLKQLDERNSHAYLHRRPQDH